MNKLPENILRRIVKVASPTSAARLATTSRQMYASTKNMLKARQTLARLLRARMLRVRRRRYLEEGVGTLPWPYNYYGRLIPTLHGNRLRAHERSRLTIAQRRAIHADPGKKAKAASAAYWRYTSAPQSKKKNAWNAFVRVHVKAGRNPNITEKQAWNFYFWH
jgi:hypothetical protein